MARIDQNDRAKLRADPCADAQRHELSDWQYEVANGDTRLGFFDWQQARREADQEDASTSSCR